MNAVIEQDVRRDIGGDQQRIGQIETDVGALTFKHVLLPVWLAAYRYRGKSFRFVVNGRTGAVEGERPYSAVKIAVADRARAARRRRHRLPPDRAGATDAAAAPSPLLAVLAALPAAAAEPPPALIEATEAAAALCRGARRHARDPRRLPRHAAT